MTHRSRLLVAGGGVVLLLASAVAPVSTEPEQFGGVSYRCGWLPVTGGTEAHSNPMLVDACRSATVERSLWCVVAIASIVMILAALALIANWRGDYATERFEPLVSSRLALVIASFAAPLLGLGIIVPLVIVIGTQRDDRVVRDFAARAFDLQCVSLLGGVTAVAVVVLGEPTVGFQPVLLLGLMSVTLAAILAISVAAVVAAARGQLWIARWRPVFLPGRRLKPTRTADL